MTPPEAPQVGSIAAPGESFPAVSSRLEVLRKRADFLAAARAAHTATPGFVVQMRRRGADHADTPPRVGFTCSKKVGNAVARNRAKRRLRALAQEVLTPRARPGTDYVLIGRRETTATLPFDQLRADLAKALARLHRASP